MKSKAPPAETGVLPAETPEQKAARTRKLRAILRKGLGLTPKELKESLWPGYAESYRSEQSHTVQEPKAPYGNRRPR